MPMDTNDDLHNASKDELIAEILRLRQEDASTGTASELENSLFIRSVLNSLPVGIAYIDRAHIYKFTNERYRAFFDPAPDKIVGRHMKDVLGSTIYQMAEAAAERALAGQTVSFETTLAVNGAERFMSVSYLPDISGITPISGFFALVQDVSEHIHMQNKLAGSEKRFQTLVDTVPHGIEEIDIDGNILFANATHHKQYGYGPNELIGKNISEFAPTREEGIDILARLKVLAREQPPTEPYFGVKKKKNGDLIDVKIEWTYKRDQNNNVIGFTTVVADVTEQKKAEQILKENADRLELCLRSANIGTFSSDLVKGTHFWDDRIHDIWGLPHGSFSYHQPEDFMNTIHPDDRDRVAMEVKRALEDDVPYDTEYRIYRPDGSVAYVQALASVERDANGTPTKFSGVSLDISERKLIENMKNEFVSTVSHELRTPLTSLRGALGLVSGGALGAIPDEALDIIRVAEKNALSLTKLVNDILDFEKAESGKLELNFKRFDLIGFIRDNLKSHQAFAEKHNVSFRFEPDQPVLILEADPDRISQVMANLLSNAAKYSPPHETVEVDVVADAEQVEVSISDKGPGIPAEFQDKIFGRFSQADATDNRNFGGTGLGLSISKLLINHHRGDIRFESSSETGTRFSFKIPLSQKTS